MSARGCARACERGALALAACAIALAIAGCGPRANSATAAGSTAFLPFAEKLADEFIKRNPGYSIAVQGGGSAVGIQAALSGAAQIGMADMVVLPEEARALNAVVVARDGIALVVHPSNPVNGLSTAQVRDVFNGKIRNWKALGGPDAPITVVSREAGSGTRSSFEQIVTDVRLSSDAIIQDSNGTIRETVATNPNAIGYLSFGVVNEKVRPVALDGVPGTIEEVYGRTVQAGSPCVPADPRPTHGGGRALYRLRPESRRAEDHQGRRPASGSMRQ